jgi:hypothetical protein
MAKKSKVRSRIVVDEAYFNLLIEKSDLLEEIFEDDDRITVTVSDFKTMNRITKDYAKLPNEATSTELYEEPGESG